MSIEKWVVAAIVAASVAGFTVGYGAGSNMVREQLGGKAYAHDQFLALGLYDQPKAYCEAYARYERLAAQD